MTGNQGVATMLQPTLPATILVLAIGTSTASAQTDWSPVVTSLSPSNRASAGLTYDSIRGVGVLFGGNIPGAQVDTWELGNAGWIYRQSGGPPARSAHGLVFDTSLGVSVLFGGRTNSQFLADTWTWNGLSWVQVVVTGPSARTDAAMAYDAARSHIVLFGGFNGTNFLNDTWTFDGTTWNQLSPANAPAPRNDSAMAFDKVTAQMLLFGGWDASTVYGDTWSWTGTNWVAVSTASSPPVRHGHAIVFDDSRSRIVLFGGNGTPVPGQLPEIALADIWEFDGIGWLQRTTPTNPPVRWSHSMAYDEGRRETILFGGSNVSGQRLGDTWMYGPTNPATSTTFGTGCTGSAGVPTLSPSSLPWLGEQLVVELTSIPNSVLNVAFGVLGLSNTTYLGSPLPQSLGPIGMPGCTQYASSDGVFLMPNLGGTAQWALSMPATTAAIGLPFYQQCAVFDFGANQIGVTVSNGVESVIGAK